MWEPPSVDSKPAILPNLFSDPLPKPTTEIHRPAEPPPPGIVESIEARDSKPSLSREILRALAEATGLTPPSSDAPPEEGQAQVGPVQVQVQVQVQKDLNRLSALVRLREGAGRGTVSVRSAEGRVEFDLSQTPRVERAELQAALKAAFGDALKIDRLQARASFDRNRDPAWAFDLAADFALLTGRTEITGDGSLRVSDGQVTGELNAAIQRSFGPNARLDGDLNLKYDASGLSARVRQEVRRTAENLNLKGLVDVSVGPEGLESLRLFGAFKRIVGVATLNAEGDLSVRPGEGTEVKAALELIHGSQVHIDADGTVRFDAEGRLADAQFRNQLKLMLDQATITSDARIRIDGQGKASGQIANAVQATLGERTRLDADLTLSFDDEGVNVRTAGALLESQLGPVNLEADLRYDQTLKGSISLAALKTFKAHANRGAVRFEGNGRIEFDSGKVTQAELETLLSVANQKSVSIDLQGRLRTRDGEVDGELSARMERFVRGVRLSSSGKLTFKDGKVESEIDATLSGKLAEARAMLDFEGGRPERFELSVRSAAPGSRVDGLGMLRLDRDGLAARVGARFNWSPVRFGIEGGVVVDRPSEVVDGVRKLERTTSFGANGSLVLPFPIGAFEAGGDLDRSERVAIRVPESTSERDTNAILEAHQSRTAQLFRDLPVGGNVERILDVGKSGRLGLQLSALNAGPPPLQAAVEFGASLEKDHLVGVRLDKREDGKIDATLWRIDAKVAARKLSLELGIDVSDTQVSQALRGKLVAGIPVKDVIGIVSPEVRGAIDSLAQRLEFEIAVGMTRKTEEAETLRFEGFDPVRDADALAALTYEQDPKPALRKLVSREDETRREKAFELGLEAFGLEILQRREKVFSRESVQRFAHDGATYESHRVSGRFEQTGKGLFEDHRFSGHMLRLMERVQGSQGDTQMQELGTIAHVAHVLEDDRWRTNQAERLERAVRAAGLNVILREAGNAKGLLFKNYGKGEIELQVSVSSEGIQKLLDTPIQSFQKKAIEVGAAIEGVGLPPSEQTSPRAIPTGAEAWRAFSQGRQALQAEFPGADYDVMKALKDRHHSVYTGRMGRAIRILRGQGKVSIPAHVVQDLRRYSDGQLVTLLKQASAGALLAGLHASPNDPDSDRQQAREYRKVTDGRSLKNDAWVEAQGRAMKNVWNKMRARAHHRGTAEIDPKELMHDVETFVQVVERMAPSRTVLDNRKDKRALTFYGAILAHLDHSQAVALASVDTERYRLLATTGLDPDAVRQRLPARISP